METDDNDSDDASGVDGDGDGDGDTDTDADDEDEDDTEMRNFWNKIIKKIYKIPKCQIVKSSDGDSDRGKQKF